MLDGFIDPDDGMFDVSHLLAEKKGFFPVPIIITESAVGYGGGAALIFLHDPFAGRVVFDPKTISWRALVNTFWQAHDPTQGMRQGNDRGTQYRWHLCLFSAAIRICQTQSGVLSTDAV